MHDLNISLVQTHIAWENPGKNLDHFEQLLTDAKPTDLLILPEMFNTGFTMNTSQCAEKTDGISMTWLQNKASKMNCCIAGSLLIEDKGKFYNRFIWMKPDGTHDYYDKRHLFRMNNEHLKMTAGQGLKIIDLNGWKINLQVCYDLRFPVWSKNNFNGKNHTYDVLVYIANWPAIRSDAYKKLLPARAIENQAYVIWVNRIGQDGNQISHSGDSMVVDPLGNTIIQAEANKEAVLNTMVSWKKLINCRDKFRVGMDWDHFSVL